VATAVAVQGKYAYVGIGRRLVVVDISDPSDPTVVGHTRLKNPYDWPWKYNVSDVAVLGDYAYVVADDNARPGSGNNYSIRPDMYVVDVSDPAAPHVVGRYGTPQMALGVAVAGHSAYVYDHDSTGNQGAASSLRVVNVSDPTRPREVGCCKTPGQGAVPQLGASFDWVYLGGQYVTVAGDYAYMPDCKGGLRVIDVSDPAAPHQVGSLEPPEVQTPRRWARVAGLAVAGDYAYVTDYWRGLRVVDISDPTAPKDVAYHALPRADLAGACTLAVLGDHAYVYDLFYDEWAEWCDGDWVAPKDGVWVVDVSDPEAPTEVHPAAGHTPAIHGAVHALALQGTYAYVGIGPRLVVADVSDPSRPAIVGETGPLPPNVIDVAVAGDHAYAALGTGGLRVLDISDPATPHEVGVCEGSWVVMDMAGNYVYLADGAGLRVVDVSDPTAPHEAGFCEAPGATGVVVSGEFAYLTGHSVEIRAGVTTGGRRNRVRRIRAWSSVSVVDISDPATPTDVGPLEMPGPPGNAEAVAVADDYAYVVWRERFPDDVTGRAYRDGLRVVSLSHVPLILPLGLAALASLALVLILRWESLLRRFRWLAALESFTNRHLPSVWRFRLLFVAALPPLAVLLLVPKGPHEVGFWAAPRATARVADVVVAGDYAYVVCVGDKVAATLRVLDVSDPAAPNEVGSARFASNFRPTEMAVIGDYAYLTDNRVLEVVDISEPTALKHVLGYMMHRMPGRRACGLALAGDYAYVADGPAGLRVLDISAPFSCPRDSLGSREVGFYHPAVPVGDVLTSSP
jgi:hypothetical protein